MKAITVGTKMTLTRNYNARLLQTNGRTLTLSAGSVVRVKQVSGLADDSRVHGVNISCMIPEGHIVVTEIHNGWDTFNSMIVPVSALRGETEIASKKASRVRARKVQINASNGSQPERFKTAREAQEAADECNVPGEIYPVIVGCCGPQYYVLLIDKGDTVEYYSALSEAWIQVSVKAAKVEAEEPELQEAGADITVVGITDKFVTFYDPATGGNAKRKIKTGEGYQHFTCDYGRYGTYTTSWFEVGGAEDVFDDEEIGVVEEADEVKVECKKNKAMTTAMASDGVLIRSK